MPRVWIAGLAYLSSSLVGCCTAFTLPASSVALSSCWNNVDSASTVVLFAGNNKGSKKKKTTKSSGGEGFGSTSTRSSTTRAAKNKPKPQQQQQQQQQQDTSRPQGDVGGPKLRATAKARREKWSQRGEDSETTTAETAMLKAIYTEQFNQQEEQRKKGPVPRRLVQISQSPLMFTIDEFVDPAACARVQSNGAGCFDLNFPEQVSDLLFNGQASELDGLLFNQASSTDHRNKNSDNDNTDAYPDGLHMDTNGRCLFRHVTAILYLNDVPEECGGATVFPLARTLPNDPALAASRRLLASQISHTRSRAVVGTSLAADAQLLETRVVGTNFGKNPNTETAIRIQPKAGRLLVFFSRYYNGEEDPRAWHAGERLCEHSKSSESESESLVTEKRILTLFKQVDYTDTHHEPSRAQTTFEDYLAPLIREQQTWLQAKNDAQLR